MKAWFARPCGPCHWPQGLTADLSSSGVTSIPPTGLVCLWISGESCRPLVARPGIVSTNPSPLACPLATGEERGLGRLGWHRVLLPGGPRPSHQGLSTSLFSDGVLHQVSAALLTPLSLGSRWSLGRSFLPLLQSPSTSCSTRRNTTSTLLMEKFLPCTGKREPQPGIWRGCGQPCTGNEHILVPSCVPHIPGTRC